MKKMDISFLHLLRFLMFKIVSMVLILQHNTNSLTHPNQFTNFLFHLKHFPGIHPCIHPCIHVSTYPSIYQIHPIFYTSNKRVSIYIYGETRSKYNIQELTILLGGMNNCHTKL